MSSGAIPEGEVAMTTKVEPGQKVDISGDSGIGMASNSRKQKEQQVIKGSASNQGHTRQRKDSRGPKRTEIQYTEVIVIGEYKFILY